MEHKEQIQKFLTAIANGKYTDADELFPKVVNSTYKNIINNNKPEVLKKLNADAEKIAISAIDLEKSSTDKKD